MSAYVPRKTPKLLVAFTMVLAIATTSTWAEQPPGCPEDGTAVTFPQSANPRAIVGA